MALDALYNSRLGADEILWGNQGVGVSTYAMAAINTGWCARFTAPDTRDIWSVWINWSAVTAAGTVQVRVETIDTTTGKPTGTLYDANASVNITPAVGWQQATFASHPTTGLTAGNEYAVVMLTTVAGTTHTLRSHLATSVAAIGPTVVLTAANGTTRSNFAEVASSSPICTLGFSDGADEFAGMSPYPTSSTFGVYGTRAFSMKFVLNSSLKVHGYILSYMVPSGTPSNLRYRIFDSGNAVVTGSTVTVQQKSLTAASGRRRSMLPAPITLAAGTYRLVVDQTDHTTTSGNAYGLYYASARIAGMVPSGLIRSDTTNVDAGPIVWTDTATDQPLMALLVDDTVAPAGGGGLFRVPGMQGGFPA